MTGDGDHDYAAGLRDGRLQSLEAIVRQQTQEMSDLRKCVQAGFKERDRELKTINRALWALGGAVGIIQFAPILRGFLA